MILDIVYMFPASKKVALSWRCGSVVFINRILPYFFCVIICWKNGLHHLTNRTPISKHQAKYLPQFFWKIFKKVVDKGNRVWYNCLYQEEIDKVNKNHQVNEYLYVVWWISKRESPEPICGQQPGVVEAKICSNSLFYIMLCYCVRG